MSTDRLLTTARDDDAMVDANLGLAFTFLQHLFDDPDRPPNIPPGATVILIPADNPELARVNFGMALQASEEGKSVVLRVVGQPQPEHDAWSATQQQGEGS